MLIFALAWMSLAAVEGLRVPDGFEVIEFAGSKLANDIHSMTIDRSGRIMVAGRGYIRTLVDDDGDGRADRAIDFADGPDFGAMGLLWDGDALYACDDGGVVRYRDRDKDDRADGPAESVVRLKDGGEHGVHALLRGPDGWFYLMCGNESGVSARFATTATSPIREPIAGCLLRFSPDWKRSEIVADGFRNPYDFDFHPTGEIFTYDSDNERCVCLPWYEPTRFYHIVPGGHHGWQAPNRAQTWRMPPWFPDIVPPVATLRRGSPTGVACYRHLQFPDRYRGGFFALDWTFGRVWFLPLEPASATFRATPEIFLEPAGEDGFAPTDVVVHLKTGDLYISIGGRGTRGGVFRIRYEKGLRDSYDPVALASLQPAARDLDPKTRFALVVAGTSAPNDAARLRLRLESMARAVHDIEPEILDDVILRGLDDPDRLVRQAAARLESTRRRAGRSAVPDVRLGSTLLSLPHLIDAGLGHQSLADKLNQPANDFQSSTSEPDRLAFVRAAQQLVGDVISPAHRSDVWAGYTVRTPTGLAARIPSQLFDMFPTGEGNVDREIARLAAMVERSDTPLTCRIAGQLTDTSDPIDDIHYLIVLSRLPGVWDPSLVDTVAGAMLRLEKKIIDRDYNRDRNWPLRIRELHHELALKHANLNKALVTSKLFGAEGHLVWTEEPRFDRKAAAEIILGKAEKDANWTWSPEFVRLVAELPLSRSAPILRGHWDHYGLRAEIVHCLARSPSPEDRSLYLEWLAKGTEEHRSEALSALEAVGVERNEDVAKKLWSSLQRLPAHAKPGEATVRRRIATLLASALGAASPNGDLDRWIARIGESRPDIFAFTESSSIDVARLRARWKAIDWNSGDAERGKTVYERLGCGQCHTGALAAGPDLAGVVHRFSKDDLLTAIVDPNRDVADRYRTTTILTRSGQTYFGIVAYEAVDSCLLLLRDGQTVRITPDEVEERRGETASLMPSGLLDPATDAQIADLLAYLRSLGDRGLR